MVLAQRVLSDEIYTEYYKNEQLRGATIIMDNGACELGKSLDGESLLKAINAIKPDILVLPDSLDNGHETIQLSSAFIRNYSKYLSGIKLMGVAQGKTKEEWISTLKHFIDNKKVSMVGISNTDAVFSNHENEFSRYKTIGYLSELKILDGTKQVHILGLGNSGHLEIEKLKEFPFIEGIDTSAPVVHGAFGVQINYSQPYQKIRKYLDADAVLTENQINTIFDNLKVLYGVL